MSRKILLICVLSVGFLFLGSASMCEGLRFGAEGGLNYGFHDFDEEKSILDESRMVAFTLGATLEIPLVDSRSVVTGLRYIRQGHDIGFDTGADDPSGRHWGDVEITQDYLSIPALIKVRISDEQRFFVKVGPEVAFLLSANADGQESKQTEFVKIMRHDNEDISDGLRSAVFHVDIGGGVEFPLGRYLASAEVRYSYGVSETAKAGKFFSNWHMNGIQLLFGMVWQ
jgi:hypothetical protein